MTSTFQQIIRLEDDTPPTIQLTCPADTVLYVDGNCMAATDTSATGSASAIFDDNCDLESDTLYYSDSVTGTPGDGCYSIERTWTASAEDACGNVSTAMCTQTITVDDDEDPTVTLTCPANTTVYVDGNCTAATDTSATGAATAMFDDNCTLTFDTLYYSDSVSGLSLIHI